MLHIAAVQVVESFRVRLLLGDGTQRSVDPVSYTHLTLPTILRV